MYTIENHTETVYDVYVSKNLVTWCLQFCIFTSKEAQFYITELLW